MFQYFNCGPLITSVTADGVTPQDDDDYEITFDKTAKIKSTTNINNNNNSTRKRRTMNSTHHVPESRTDPEEILMSPTSATGHKRPSTPASPRPAASQKGLSAVVVMQYDEYGQLKRVPKSRQDFDESDTQTGGNCKVIDRLKQQQHQSETTKNNGEQQQQHPQQGSCKVVERLHRNKEFSHQDGHRGRSKSEIQRSMKKSPPRVEKRIKSIHKEFAGISPSPSMTKKDRSLKKSKSVDKEPIKVQHSNGRKKRKMHSWFRKWKAKRISSFGKRHNKVANNDNDSCSVSTHAFSVSTLATRSIASIASSRRRRKKKRRKTDHETMEEPLSILRRSTVGAGNASNPSLDLTSLDCASDGGASAGVKFAKGTVFQDPNQTERKRCPRLPGRQKRPGTDKNHRGITHKRVLALRKTKKGGRPSLDATMTALSLDEGNGCNPMEELTPLVDAVVAATTQSMGCDVYP
jgi:hypothetical protein